MGNRNKEFIARLCQLGAEQILLPIGDGLTISWLTLQAIIFLIGCLVCSCCSISSYVWGSMSPNLTMSIPTHIPTPTSPTRTATVTPAAPGTEEEVETHTPTPTPVKPSKSTSTPIPTSATSMTTPARPAVITVTSQSPLPTPMSAPLPTSTPTNTPTPSAIPQPTPTPTGTLQTGPPIVPAIVHIIHVEYKPPGSDLDGEHVIIENLGPGDQDMTGWTLSNEKAHTYFFPAGFILPDGTTIRVWTKRGTDTAIELYWGRDEPVWDNESGTAYLRDNTGTVMAYLDW